MLTLQNKDVKISMESESIIISNQEITNNTLNIAYPFYSHYKVNFEKCKISALELNGIDISKRIEFMYCEIEGDLKIDTCRGVNFYNCTFKNTKLNISGDIHIERPKLGIYNSEGEFTFNNYSFEKMTIIASAEKTFFKTSYPDKIVIGKFVCDCDDDKILFYLSLIIEAHNLRLKFGPWLDLLSKYKLMKFFRNNPRNITYSQIDKFMERLVKIDTIITE